jgi:hypothetical protein
MIGVVKEPLKRQETKHSITTKQKTNKDPSEDDNNNKKKKKSNL